LRIGAAGIESGTILTGKLPISLLVVIIFLISVSVAHAFKLPDTGQTTCYDSSGNVINCAGTGQDGEYTINPMSYNDNGDGTVTDNITGLMWQKCSVGQNNDSTCSGTAAVYTWYQASGTYDATYNPSSQDVCGSLSLGGHTDWRLPTKKELITIVDYSIPYSGPAINTTYFSNTAASDYWSSTTYAIIPVGAWGVDFDGGYVGGGNKYGAWYVRCVRGGQ
jgi:Protein of unknown function (DUF1566)